MPQLGALRVCVQERWSDVGQTFWARYFSNSLDSTPHSGLIADSVVVKDEHKVGRSKLARDVEVFCIEGVMFE